MDLETKAFLISIGTIEFQQDYEKGQISTAGPSAGGRSVFFQSGKNLVRLSVVPESPLRLIPTEGGFTILEEEKEIAHGVLIEPLLHCPNQAYITVSERCIYNCKFCAVPKLHGNVKSPEQIKMMVETAKKTGYLKAISLTSGVEVSPKQEAYRVAQIVSDLKRFKVPIGVSVSPFSGINKVLKDAGSDEVKYNLECVEQDLFPHVCPGIEFQEIMESLREGVETFGKGHIFSNIIIGLGESNKALHHGIDELTEMGVLPILRAVYVHPLRCGEFEMNRPSKDRLISMAYYLKRALEKNSLRGDCALTGCYMCTGCDLVVHRDL